MHEEEENEDMNISITEEELTELMEICEKSPTEQNQWRQKCQMQSQEVLRNREDRGMKLSEAGHQLMCIL